MSATPATKRLASNTKQSQKSLIEPSASPRAFVPTAAASRPLIGNKQSISLPMWRNIFSPGSCVMQLQAIQALAAVAVAHQQSGYQSGVACPCEVRIP
jgi:hypothetical protein